MKPLFFVLLSTFLAGAGSLMSAQEIKARSQHPRLFFTAERIAQLQERIKTEPSQRRRWWLA